MEYLSQECKEALLVSDHAVIRYVQRSGESLNNRRKIVAQLKSLAGKYPIVKGDRGRTYIRITAGLNEAIWLVLQGRIIKTILTHRQYLSNCDHRGTE